MKKGQVTVFIIIGIIILVAMAFFFFLKQEVITDDLMIQDNLMELDSLKIFVTDCLEEATIDAIYEVLDNGGYYQVPTDQNIFSQLTDEEQFELPYYFIDEESNVPSIEVIQEEVAKAAESHFLFCIDDFESFEKQGYAIESENPEFIIMFSRDNTLSYLTYLLTIELDNKVSEINKFSGLIDFDFSSKYDILENYFAEQEDNPEYFLVGNLATLIMENEDTFWFNQYNDHGSDVMLTLNYDDVELRDEPLLYNFALNYDWNELDDSVEEDVIENLVSEENDYTFSLEEIPVWEIPEPGIFTLQVEATGEDLEFEIDSGQLEIGSSSGLITLNTNNLENGEHLFYVKVTDINNDTFLRPLEAYVNVNDGTLPMITPILDMVAHVGEEFTYEVNVENYENGKYFFSSDTHLIEINALTGVISFTPTEYDVGKHSVRIDVENEYGITWERWILEIS